MEIKSKTIKDILKVTFSNACILLSGILVGFLLPKIIDQVDYGYYKTFTLYIAYIGLFHFGIIDGIYLKYGDKDYNELDKEKFRFYTRFLLILEGAISLLFIIISLFAIQEKEMKFIFVMVSLTLFSTNITSYFQYISQITRRFKELTLRNIVQSILISLAIISLFISYKYFRLVINFEIYTIIYVIILFLLMVWYIFAYRDITFGKASKGLYKDIFYFLKIGFPLLIANLAINLIFMIDRQFVNILYDKVTYATYAFSYNMLSLITTLINSIALVIYPTIKRSKEFNSSTYQNLISIISTLVFVCLLVYYPLDLFIHWFLPKYNDSLVIFRIILPGLITSSCISIVMQNYYKLLNKNLNFFIKSLVIIALSIGLNFLAYYIFKNQEAISVASIIVTFIWYITIESYFVIHYKVKFSKNLLFIVLATISFYLITMSENYINGFIFQLVFTLNLVGVFYGGNIIHFIKKFVTEKKISKK